MMGGRICKCFGRCWKWKTWRNGWQWPEWVAEWVGGGMGGAMGGGMTGGNYRTEETEETEGAGVPSEEGPDQQEDAGSSPEEEEDEEEEDQE
ncbi:hypothetical protein JCM33374_g5119 [Metschnikowia sp. JCM 33374]|nr:hypothetical protein JCM33374_g5119 [Metschnikowia sp. JCM 33374]